MRHHLIWWSNIALGLGISLALVAAIWMFALRDSSFEQLPVSPRTSELPHAPFTLEPKDYESVGSSSLKLTYSPPSIHVPDLRTILQYHGRNQRPDAGTSSELLVSLGQKGGVLSILPGSKQYLIPNPSGGGYAFNPVNRPTDLWIEVKPQGQGVDVSVEMRDEKGQIHRDLSERAHFHLQEKPLPPQSAPWMIDQMRVDATLLSRMHARWSGRDLFLEAHGGPTYQSAWGKDRIVWGEPPERYSSYVGAGDWLVWKGGKWVSPAKGEPTERYPLLKIEKIDERVLHAVLFDVGGQRKLLLNLIKTPDPISEEGVLAQFRFVGARTRIHAMFKVANVREIVGPEDWFLLTPEGWKKVKTGKEVDEYVAGTLTGPLLVIDQLHKSHEEKWFHATLYNASRSGFKEIRIDLKTHPVAPPVSVPVDSKTDESTPSPPP